MITINDMQEVAKLKNGKCLSEQYISSQTKLKWECSKGHIWEANPNNIKRGRWCPTCNHLKTGDRVRKYSIETAQKIAAEKGGFCLTEIFTSVNQKLLWECKNGHKWEATLHMVKNGKTWCTKCYHLFVAGKYHIDNIENLKQIAIKRKGICLSDTYVNAYGEMLWQCEKGHQWLTNSHNIKHGSWCNECHWFKGEKAYRKLLEYVFDAKFPKTRCYYPSIDKRLEIDGINNDLKLAFEFQGTQHFKFPNYYHKTLDSFKKQQNNDKLKKELLEKDKYHIFYPTDKMNNKRIIKYTI